MTSKNESSEGALNHSNRDPSDQHDALASSPPEDNLASDEAQSGFIRDDRREGGPPPIDPSDFFTADGGMSEEFDRLLEEFEEEQPRIVDDEEFGTLKESQITQGANGILPPELDGEELDPGEIAFGLSGGELQTIVRTLSLLLRFQPKERRRCRITITSDGVKWQGNQGNGFIEYSTPGAICNLAPGSAHTLIVAHDDLKAVARAAREVATFRIRKDAIRFASGRFRRPILTHSARSFPSHTDTLLSDVDLTALRPDLASASIGPALAFLGTIAPPSDEDDPHFNVIQIKNSLAHAVRRSIAAQVKSSMFDGLDIAFRPHFLRWMLPAFKLRASFQAWHSDKFCVFKNENLLFGFELVPQELPQLPTKTIADTILTPAARFVTFVERSVRMLKNDGKLTLISDQQGNEQLIVRADDEGQTSRVISATLDSSRDGKNKGPIKITAKAALVLKALRVSSSHANVELSIAEDALFLQDARDEAVYSVMIAAKVAL